MRLTGLGLVRLCAILLSGFVLATASAATAATETIGDVATPTSTYTGTGLMAQSFTVPPKMTRIVAAKLGVRGRQVTELSIRRGSGAAAPVVGLTTAVPDQGVDGIVVHDLTLAAEGIPVTPGETLYLVSSIG